MGMPLVRIRATPLVTDMAARVTMKGLIFILEINRPLNIPTAVPAAKPKQTDISTDNPECRAKAIQTPLSATIAPTDKSIPLVQMTNVIPTEIITSKALWSRMLRQLSQVIKNGDA
jgi:hypothetical protein